MGHATVETFGGVDLDTIDGLTVLQALSDPVRLEIVRQLEKRQGSRC